VLQVPYAQLLALLGSPINETGATATATATVTATAQTIVMAGELLQPHITMWTESLKRSMPARITHGGVVRIPIYPAEAFTGVERAGSAATAATAGDVGSGSGDSAAHAAVVPLGSVLFRAAFSRGLPSRTAGGGAVDGAVDVGGGISTAATTGSDSSQSREYASLFPDCGSRLRLWLPSDGSGGNIGSGGSGGGHASVIAAGVAVAAALPSVATWQCGCNGVAITDGEIATESDTGSQPAFVGATEAVESLVSYFGAMFGSASVAAALGCGKLGAALVSGWWHIFRLASTHVSCLGAADSAALRFHC
jgi:hypothetical protein